MVTVSISDLKAHLARYLRLVKRGSEVQILDRGVPVARLTGIGGPPRSAASDAERRSRLIQAGVLRPGHGNSSIILKRAPISLSTTLSDVLKEDREDRL